MKTKAKIDPVDLEIMWQRVISIVEECWVTIWRTSFSVVVGEALDYGCEILDTKGRVLAHPWRSMPAFNFCLPNCLRVMLEKYPVESLKPGDVIITNDPWACAGHLFDITILTPVFNRKGKCVAIMGGVANVADIGGTRARHTTREVYDEGLFLPPLKLYDRGKINKDLVEIIENNVRLAPMVMGDIHAMVAANQVGADRILAFLDEYGLDDLEELTAEVQSRTEKAMREAIAALPDGTYEAEQHCTSPGAPPFKFKVQVTVKGDTLHVEYLDVPPQFSIGGTNSTLSILVSETIYLLKCLLTPEVPANDGDFRPITVWAPEGSVLNATRPACVNMRTRTLWNIAPAIFQAMAPIMPDKVPAPIGFPETFKTYGRTGRGFPFNDHMFQGGGQGGHPRGDGQTTVLFSTSAGNVSVEMFELRTGFLVEEKEFIPDSGGPGKFRGAPGQRITMRRRPGESGGQYLLGVWPVGLGYDTPGLQGGKPGSRMRLFFRRRPDQPVEEIFIDGVFENFDEHMWVSLEQPGGSGWGDPAQRDPALIKQDLVEEYITPEGARRDYGWEDDGK